MRTLSYGRQCLDDDDIRAVVEALKSDFLTTGPLLEAFEKAVAARVGVPYAVAVCNGTAALHLAVLALELPAGFIGATPPMTFAASANAFVYCGGRVAFVDIGEKTPNISPEKLEDFCRKKGPPAVVTAVSFAGVPADLPALAKLASRHGFRLIEDAAHSLGSEYKSGGKWLKSGCCAHSDLAVFSFHPVKNLTTAEGGMVLTADRGLYEKLLMLRNHGISREPGKMANRDLAFEGDSFNPWYYEISGLGFNARLSELHAALGLSQLKKLDAFKAARKRLVERYNEAFGRVPGLIVPCAAEGLDPMWHLYALRLEGGAPARARLFRRLKENGIAPMVHYVPLNRHPHFRKHSVNAEGPFPAAEAYYSSVISLPLYPSLSDEDQRRVIEAVLAFKGRE